MDSLMLVGELALRALLLGSMGVVAAWLMRGRGAEAQHAIWRIVLAAMLALPLLMAVVPPLPILPAHVVTTIGSSVTPAEQVMPSSALASPASPASVGLSANPPGRSDVEISSPGWPTILVAIYGSIAALLLSGTAISVYRAKKAGSAATRITVGLFDNFGYPRTELRESADVAVPFTIGWRNPIIVLPKDWREWDEFKLRSVLVHELAHVQRADWATAVAAAVNKALFCYHPLAWWLERRLADLAEEACDAAAIRSMGDGPKYARVVLEFASAASLNPVMVATSISRTQVGRRIEGILEGRVGLSRAMTGLAGALMLALALPAVYGAAAFELTRQIPVQSPAAGPSLSREEAYMAAALEREASNPSTDAYRALLAEGWQVTPEQAVRLEAQLALEPENVALRGRLLSYYTQYMIPEPRTAHLLWLIEHHPEADIFRLGSEVTSALQSWTGLNTPPNAERARALWLLHAEQFSSNTKVLANAAVALSRADSRISLTLVRRAREVEPGDPQWVNWLGVTYARAIRASFAGGRENIGVFAASGGKLPWSAFSLPLAESELLKNELETSKDAALVGATAEALIEETSLLKDAERSDRPARIHQEILQSEAFGKHLFSRARALDPKNPRWQD